METKDKIISLEYENKNLKENLINFERKEK
jgi:hypothetical protein